MSTRATRPAVEALDVSKSVLREALALANGVKHAHFAGDQETAKILSAFAVDHAERWLKYFEDEADSAAKQAT